VRSWVLFSLTNLELGLGPDWASGLDAFAGGAGQGVADCEGAKR
jgi:hypothetical protein